jgi:hypothetical protein
LREIDAVEAKPDGDGFLVKVEDHQLGREADAVITCELAEQGGRCGEEEASLALDGVEGDGSGGGEVGLAGGVDVGSVGGEITAWTLGTEGTGGTRGARAEGSCCAGCARGAGGARGACAKGSCGAGGARGAG